MYTECENCQAGKKPKRRKQCQVHTFAIKNICPNDKVKYKTTVNLCPLIDKDSHVYHNIFPQFNPDGKTYLPAFTLSVDDNYYASNQSQYESDHNRKVQQSLCSEFQEWEPKPYNQSRYCSVCRSNYKNYQQHIVDPLHKLYINKNKYNNYITQTCREFQGSFKRLILCEGADIPRKYRLMDLLPIQSEEVKVGKSPIEHLSNA